MLQCKSHGIERIHGGTMLQYKSHEIERIQVHLTGWQGLGLGSYRVDINDLSLPLSHYF